MLLRTEEQDARYRNLDNDPRGVWTSGDVSVKTYSASTDFPITTPSGRIVNPPNGYCWRFSKEKFQELVNDKRIYFGSKGDSVPRFKRFLSDVQQGTVPLTIWTHAEVGHNQSAKQELKKIFYDSAIPFETPKPTSLLEKFLQISSDKNSIILDSFAGSGTTAHAVLNLNKQDEGNRKFILVEMEDYAETITAERVRRVMNGYASTEGLGGSFDFYELGQPMFMEDGNLNELVGVEKIRQYVFYTETNSPLTAIEHRDNKYFLGKHNDTCYYFDYEQDGVTTLDYAFLSAMKTKAEQYVVYADNCLLTKEFMTKNNIIFKKIPRDITRF